MNEQRVRVWVQRFYDRPTLILQWVDPDTRQRKSQSAKTTDFEMAEIARRNLEYELNHGIYQETTKLEWERFRELFEGEYLAGLRLRTQEPKTKGQVLRRGHRAKARGLVWFAGEALRCSLLSVPSQGRPGFRFAD
jgi:hypothetical protein